MSPTPEKEDKEIKFSVMDPYSEGAVLNMEDYINNKHMADTRANPAMKGIIVENGLTGRDPGSKPPYICVAHIFYESVEAMMATRTPERAAKLRADIRNFTNVTPIHQVGEIVFGNMGYVNTDKKK